MQVLGDKELPRTAAGLEALQEFVDTVKVLVDAQGLVLHNSSPEAKQEVCSAGGVGICPVAAVDELGFACSCS